MFNSSMRKMVDRIEKELEYTSYPLHIGILGIDRVHSEEILKKIVKSDRCSVVRLTKDQAVMSDGTIYKTLSYSGNVKSIRIDQLIISNNTKGYQIVDSETYDYLTYRLGVSCVPEEFQIQFIDY